MYAYLSKYESCLYMHKYKINWYIRAIYATYVAGTTQPLEKH